LLDDSRYGDTSLRYRHRDTLIPVIEDVIIKKPTAHWLGLLERAGVPCAPIERFDEVFSDRHLNARSYFWDAPHPKLGSVRQLGSPMRFSETPVRREKAGPLLGEDSAALLSELGYTPAEIEALVARRVTAGPAQPVSG
jgi:formyl-CoA transferase